MAKTPKTEPEEKKPARKRARRTSVDRSTAAKDAEPAENLPANGAPTTSAVVALDQMQTMSGAGLEEAAAGDFAIPFLHVLQGQSPALEDLEDAEPGDFLLTSTQELWAGDDGVQVIPCYYQQVYIEWVPREQGGGFVAIHPRDSDVTRQAVRRGHKDVLPNGNELSRTAQFFVLVRAEDGWTPALLTFKSTGLKTARQWCSLMSSQRVDGPRGAFTPPTFGMIYTLTTERQTNSKGTWYQVRLGKKSPKQVTEDEVYSQAHALYQSTKGGMARVDYEQAGDTGSSVPGSRPGFDEDESSAERPF